MNSIYIKCPSAVCFIVALSSLGNAEEVDFPTLDSLGLKGASAFALSGKSPSEINRPTSLRSFGLSIVGSGGEDFAFEASPFWWGNPTFSYDQVYDSGLGTWDVISQSLTFSGAHYSFENAAGVDVRGISAGMSFDLIRGRLPNSTQVALKKFDDLFQVPLPSGQARVDRGSLEAVLNNQELIAAANAAGDALEKGRVGFNLSFAAAVSYEYEDKDYHNGDVAKYGAWLTASYRADGTAKTGPSPWTFLGHARYLRDETVLNEGTYFDLGGRLIYDFKKMPLTLSAEYIHRFGDVAGDAERWAALLEYEVNDDWSVFLTHGTNFDDLSRKDEVFTYAGFSFGAGNAPTYQK